MTRVTALPQLRRFIAQHQYAVGWVLALLVLAALAFDYFVGFGGKNLLGLRLIYTALMLLLAGYMYLVGTAQDKP
ncbi:MAG: hypothetical protein H7095_07620 [Pseudopedobacter sp.]|nr:hypothetical protein [Deinococcales bacterium]